MTILNEKKAANESLILWINVKFEYDMKNLPHFKYTRLINKKEFFDECKKVGFTKQQGELILDNLAALNQIEHVPSLFANQESNHFKMLVDKVSMQRRL